MANFEIGGELAVEISWIARGPKKKPGHYVSTENHFYK